MRSSRVAVIQANKSEYPGPPKQQKVTDNKSEKKKNTSNQAAGTATPSSCYKP